MPDVITGLSLLLLFVALGHAIGWPSDRGMLTIWLAHVTFCTAYVAVVISSRLRELDREAGVEHVGACHALVHEARLIADIVRDPGEEGDHVMLGDRFDRVDRGHVDHRVGGPPGPERLRGLLWHHAEFGECISGVRLDLEPDAELRFGFPDFDHVGPRVAGDHKLCLYCRGELPRG